MPKVRRQGGEKKSLFPSLLSLWLYLIGGMIMPMKSFAQDGLSLENVYLRFTVSRETLAWRIEEKGSHTVWQTEGRGEIWLADRGGAINLSEAREKKGEKVSEDTLLLTLSDFPSVNGLVVKLTFKLEGNQIGQELDIPEGGEAFRGCYYPGAFLIEGDKEYVAVPIRSGCLIPGDWKENLNLYYPVGGAWMGLPWYGFAKGKSALLVILDTPFDAGIHIKNPPGGPPLVGHSWEASMLSLRYPRRVFYSFKDTSKEELPAYNWMTKTYRDYVKRSGRFKPLTDKIERLPNLKLMLGAIVVPTLIAYYDKQQPAPQLTYTSFQERARQLERLYEAGIRGLYIHLDGWGKRGYDNLHPDPLPPCPDAGGWEGLRELSLTADKLGYLFGLHDNYRDFYLDSPAFDEALTRKEANGKSPRYSIWPGGEQSELCATVALPFVKRTFEEMQKHGVKLTASYLDVFSSVPPEECYDPRHPMTREDSTRYRNQCLDYVNSLGIIVTSEDGADWAIPVINLPYWIPSPGFGVTVPLFELVYHDSVIVPNDIMAGDESFLRALLYGELPMIGIDAPLKAFKNVQVIRDLEKEVGTAEMVWHRFLNGDYSKQETCFSNGISIWVDLDSKKYRIKGAKEIPSEEREVPSIGYDVRVKVSDFKYLGGRSFEISYEWEVKEEIPGDYRCFNHFLNEAIPQEEHIAFGADHFLAISTSKWRVGELIKDGPHRVDIPPGLPLGSYEVVIGLFDMDSGARLPLRGVDAHSRLHLGFLEVIGEGDTIRDIRFIPVP